jgi:hypothetical protein
LGFLSDFSGMTSPENAMEQLVSKVHGTINFHSACDCNDACIQVMLAGPAQHIFTNISDKVQRSCWEKLLDAETQGFSHNKRGEGEALGGEKME